MALVHNRFEVVASFMETSGKTVDRTYVAGDSITTLGELAVSWAIALPLIKATSDSVMSSYTYKEVFIEDALALPSSAENNNQALFTGKILDDPTDSAIVSIPAIKPGLMVALTGKGYDIVDMGDAAVLSFIKLFDSGETNGDWVISDGESWQWESVAGRRRNTKSTNS
jgi:hypothetical protein